MNVSLIQKYKLVLVETNYIYKNIGFFHSYLLFNIQNVDVNAYIMETFEWTQKTCSYPVSWEANIQRYFFFVS